MAKKAPGQLTRQGLLDYLLEGAVAREGWMVGMEVEKLGRAAGDGQPLPYDAPGPSVRKVLEFVLDRRGGDPVFEATNLVGVDGPWGTVSLEPGGQVEWSSRPEQTLSALEQALEQHLATLGAASSAVGVRWLDVAVDPVHPLEAMHWMPRARYKIMRAFLAERGRLAQRMMTQTASIQCAFDYADAQDWSRKFRAAALLSPLAVALFANSTQVDGAPSGFRSFRQAIWRETDPARCGLPAVVFEPGFDMERWLDWVLDVPTIFRHRARGLVPTGAATFRSLMALTGCDALRPEDWEIHASTIFTEVRAYTYLEVRSADLQPDGDAFAVPALWTGVLYDERALDAALELATAFDDRERWSEAMHVAARQGLDARHGRHELRELAAQLLAIAAAGLRGGAACADDPPRALRPLERLADRHRLPMV